MAGEAARFAEAFFAAHGAALRPLGPGVVEVVLPEDMEAAFGASPLRLSLGGAGAGEADTVVPGGRVFDAMVAHLGPRGRCAAFRRRPGPEAPVALASWGGDVRAMAPEAADRVARVYDFHLSFLTDERVDMLWSVALDEAGRRWEAPLAWLAEQDELEDLPGPGAAHHLLALAEGVARAEHLARAHAERAAAGPEVAAAERLATVEQRLVAFHAELEAELPLRRKPGQADHEALAAWEAARRDVRAELARRLASEAQRHRLRVLVRAVGHALVVSPGVRWRWRLSAGPVAREVAAWQDLATGEVAWPPCERCGRADGGVGLCQLGHLVCAACQAPCRDCAAACCGAELVACGCCGARLCQRCRAGCATGHPCCRTHLVACACCGRQVCSGCGATCPACERWLAPAHRCGCHARKLSKEDHSATIGHP
jgi:hypothetical protein